MVTVQQIAFSFNYSAERLRVFQAELELNKDAHVGLNNRTDLQTLRETRLFSRTNVLCTFKSAFTAVVTALEHLKIEDRNFKAGRYLLSTTNVDFIITLVTSEHFLQSRLPMTTSYTPSSVISAKEPTTIANLQQERQ